LLDASRGDRPLSKHRDRQFFIARSVFGLAVAVLIGLVMWIAVPADPAWPSASASPSVSTSPSPSVPASPAPSKSSASPTPSKTSKSPKPTPSRTSSSPAAPNDLSANYFTSSSWGDGFIAMVQVTNNGSAAHDFTVTLNYPGGAGLSVRSSWNGSATASGNQITVRGNSLAAGSTITVGFQAGKRTRDQVKPTGCTVGGGSCRVS
jgi:cytoskeletal protein RodZ